MAANNKICIKDGIVVNVIFADDDFVDKLLQAGQYDNILNQDDFKNIDTNIGNNFDGQNFTPPDAEKLSNQDIYEIKIQKAIFGFNAIMIQYVASNVLLGITQQGKTKLIADTLADVQRYGQSGSLYAAISSLQSIKLTADMDPFLNQNVVNDLVTQTKVVLASL